MSAQGIYYNYAGVLSYSIPDDTGFENCSFKDPCNGDGIGIRPRIQSQHRPLHPEQRRIFHSVSHRRATWPRQGREKIGVLYSIITFTNQSKACRTEVIICDFAVSCL